MKITKKQLRQMIMEEIHKEGVIDSFKKAMGPRDEALPGAPLNYQLVVSSKGGESFEVPIPASSDDEAEVKANEYVQNINKEEVNPDLFLSRVSLKDPQGNTPH